MPELLTYKSVMLLSRARLIALRRDIKAKIRRAGAVLTDLDHRMLYLAEQAIRMLGDGPAIPDVDAPHDLSTGISKFAVMGTAGPNLPGTGKILVDGHDWARQAMHGGRPDPNRERLVARTTDFVFKFWAQAQAKVTASSLSASQKTSALAGMRAYALGHLCHVAADVITQPWIDDLEATLGSGPDRRFSFGAPGKLDSRIAVQVLDRNAPRTDAPWTRWWPSPEDVPAPFYEAFAAAFVDTYGQTPTALTPADLSNAYRTAIGALSPPEMNAAFVKDAYQFWYHGVVGVAYNYRYWDWALLFVPMLVTFAFQLIAYPLLPNTQKSFAKPFWEVGERAAFDLVSFALLSSAPAALTYGIAAVALTNGGGELTAGFGLASGILLLIGLVFFFITLGASDDDLHPALRWLLLVVLPAAIPIVFFVLALTNTSDTSGIGGMQLVHALPFVMMLVTLVLYFLPFLPVGAGSAALGAEDGGLIAIYVVLAVLTMAGLVAAWLGASSAIRDWFLPQTADETFEERGREVRHSRLITDRNMLVRLYDDATLFHDPALGAAAVNRGVLHYPTGRRPLLRLWWAPGAPPTGNVWVRSDRFQLVFASAADGSGPTVTVEAPLFPMTAAEYAAFLAGLGVAFAGVTGQLRASVIDPADWDYELPAGATFADHGDATDTVEAHDAAAARFSPLGGVDDDTAYVLSHANPVDLAARFGKSGPVVSDGRESRAHPGLGTLRTDGDRALGDGTNFTQLFSVGDRIKVGAQLREVTRVLSPTELKVASDFNPAVAAGAAYERVGFDVEDREGFSFISQIGQRVGGDSLMDRAADLGALLCMGAVPHLLDAAAVPAPDLSAKGGRGMPKVYQVFRNWNLDRRRVNEWRMLVQGGALSEKGGNPAAHDPAMIQPPPGGYVPRNAPAGEAAANALGWVPLLRQWAAGLASNDDPLAAIGTPTRQSVAQAMAFLFDLPDPQRM